MLRILTVLIALFSGTLVTQAQDVTIPVKAVKLHGADTIELCSYDLLAPCDVFTGTNMGALGALSRAMLGYTDTATDLSLQYYVVGNNLCLWVFDETQTFDQGDKVGCAVISGRG